MSLLVFAYGIPIVLILGMMIVGKTLDWRCDVRERRELEDRQHRYKVAQLEADVLDGVDPLSPEYDAYLTDFYNRYGTD